MLQRILWLSLVISFTSVGKVTESHNLDPLTPVTEVYLQQLATEYGIGIRLAGTKAEEDAADFIQKTLEAYGYSVNRQRFSYINRRTKESQVSQNIVTQKAGTSGKNIILGAHYDSTSAKLGSLGAVDNGASIAIMLAIAKLLSELETQKYGVTIIAFGAEEVGLVGAYEYVKQASSDQIENYLGMINLDGIVGSDNMYIHSAHSVPYACGGNTDRYKFEVGLRDILNKVAKSVTEEGTFKIHPGYDKYPAGETGGWSDHAPFACVGLPIGNFESTNFSINGESGKDGYSQSTHPDLWDCFDEKNMTACDRKTEKQWGKIWHTKNDRLDRLETLFPGRIRQQISDNLKVLRAFLTQLDKHIDEMQNN
jgi:putative aminopeptidase FrvX